MVLIIDLIKELVLFKFYKIYWKYFLTFRKAIKELLRQRQYLVHNILLLQLIIILHFLIFFDFLISFSSFLLKSYLHSAEV